MKKIICIVTMCLFFASCGDKKRDSERGVSLALEIPTTDQINAITVWVFNSDNLLKEEHRYSSLQEQVANYIPLAAGTYTIVAATNLTDIFESNAVGDVTKLDELIVKLKSPSVSPQHPHYAKSTATVGAKGITNVAMSMSRVLAELQFTIKDVPSEVLRVEAKVTNTSNGFFPGSSKLSPETVITSLGEVSPTGNVVSFPNIRLMPVVESVTDGDNLQTHLSFTFHYNNGGTISFDVNTPAMFNGGAYTPTVDYSQFRPGVTLQINAINGWVELPAIEGEILNPSK